MLPVEVLHWVDAVSIAMANLSRAALHEAGVWFSGLVVASVTADPNIIVRRLIGRAREGVEGQQKRLRLEREADALCAGLGRIDRIATAAALDYIDFRYPHDWRSTAPRLAAWLSDMLERPAMAATRPR